MKVRLKSYFRSPLSLWQRDESTESVIHQQETKHHEAGHHNPLWLSDVALDVASMTDLKQELPATLSTIQQHLNQGFAYDAQCHVYLLIRASNTDTTPEIIHTPHHVVSGIVLNQLRYSFGHQTTHNNAAEIIPLQGSSSQLFSQPLTCDGGFPQTWLILQFDKDMPKQANIHHHTSSISHILTRSLSALFQRQQELQQAISTERCTQAAELHDSMAQILGYLRLKTSQLVSTSQSVDNSPLQTLSKDIAYQTQCAYRTIRELISTSRLSMQDKTLSQSIKEVIRECEQQSNIVFELDNRIVQPTPAGEKETQLHFIVREALSNIVRHSHATHARVKLNSDKKHLAIQIEDNGHGIQKENKRDDSFGLIIMQERARKIGAELTIQHRQPHGTTIDIRLNHSGKA